METIKKLWEFIYNNSTPISITIMVIVLAIISYLIVKAILKHLDTHDIKVKVGNIEVSDTDDEDKKEVVTSTYNGKDRRYAKDYYKEKIEKLILTNKKIRQIVRNKQYDIAYSSLKAIELLCLNIFEKVLIEYCTYKNIKLDGENPNDVANISYSRPYLIYERIIKSITQENLHKALKQINRNGIHKLRSEKWERYKRGKIQHYHSEAEKTFKDFYTVKGCLVPVKWVKDKCMEPLGTQIKDILLKTQDDLRNEAVKAYNKIKLNNRKIEHYFSKF